MANALNRKENSWVSFSPHHPDQSVSNQHLKSLALMRDAGAATAANTSSTTTNDDLLVLGIAANKKYIIVFHHFMEL
jgi:hypothetical protein